MSRRDREKAARANATSARPSKASKLQTILDAWDAWSPDSWSNQEKWIQGCNAVEAAIEAARTDVPNARTEASWLVEGLKDAAREADDRPEIHERAAIHGDLHAVLRELVEALDAAVLAMRTDHSPARSSTGNRRVDDALEAARVAVDLGAKVSGRRATARGYRDETEASEDGLGGCPMTSPRDLLAAWDTWRHSLDGDRPPRFAEDNAWERLSALFETVREDATKDSLVLGVLRELFDALEDPGIQITSIQKPLCDRVIAALFATRDLLESEQATASASHALGRLG